MIPVKQLMSGEGGDCFAACVAAILELPLNEVPNWFADSKAGDKWTDRQWEDLKKFCKAKGFKPHWLDPDSVTDLKRIKLCAELGIDCIATGQSANGNWGHCVIYRGGKMIHDPGKTLGKRPKTGSTDWDNLRPDGTRHRERKK